MRAAEEFLDVSGLLEPKSIAVIGASDRPGNLGGDTVRRLVKFKYPGAVWPISRSSSEVAGVKAYPSIAEAPGVADLVVLGIPADGLVAAIRECIAAGVRNGIAFAGGLAEAGGDGARMQAELVDLCRANDFKLCGPNCVGIINNATPATPTFASALHEIGALRVGPISMVSQSGGLGTTFYDMVLKAGFGFRYMISSGNEAVVGFADYLYALAQDDKTRIIVAYLEGVNNGPKLVRALAQAQQRGKTVVIIKSGASRISARAAAAHTAALAGEDRVFDAILQELGAIRVYSIEELLDVTLMLASAGKSRIPPGPGVGIVTFGGGNGVLGVDQCENVGLTVPPLRPETVARLKPLLASTATAANPLDLTPTTASRVESLAQLPAALDVFAAQEDIDALLLIVSSMGPKMAEIAQIMTDMSLRCEKPVSVCWPATPAGAIERLASHGIYCAIEPARIANAMSRVLRHGAARKRPARAPAPAPRPFDWLAHVPGAASYPLVVSEDQCHRLLRAAGLPVAAGGLAADEAAALRIADQIGLPVALKGISPQVTHRAAAGLLDVDLRSRDEVAAAYRRLATRAKEISVRLDGIYVQKMHHGGIELLVSAFRDPIFGLVVSVGGGGGLTELIKDVVIERAPFDAAVAAGMIDRLRIRRHARDGRGEIPVDPAAAFVADFSRLAATAPWGRFIFEVNPIKWARNAAVAVDGLLIVEEL
jgi:acetate---CoA ligase (ADP-forming)